MNRQWIRSHLPTTKTDILALLAFFGVFIIGVIVGNTVPDDQVTTFSPSNNVEE